MEFNYKGIALIPIITFIVSAAKKLGVPCKFAPILSLIVGITFGILFLSDGDIKNGILLGMVMGMSASGLYSNGKEIEKTVKRRRGC